MKNLKKISEISKSKTVSVFYSPKEDAVYNKPGDGRFYITDLINENTPQQIETMVKFFMAL